MKTERTKNTKGTEITKDTIMTRFTNSTRSLALRLTVTATQLGREIAQHESVSPFICGDGPVLVSVVCFVSFVFTGQATRRR